MSNTKNENSKKHYPTPRGAAATAAKRKYNAKTYDRFELPLPKGMKAELDKLSKDCGYSSRREFMLDLIFLKYIEVYGVPMEFDKAANDDNSKEDLPF